jgi:hypothetical protein
MRPTFVIKNCSGIVQLIVYAQIWTLIHVLIPIYCLCVGVLKRFILFDQTYDALEQRLAVSEATQRLRLPLLSKDGDVPDDDTAEWGNVSRSSFDSITTSISLSTTTTVHTTTASTASATVASGSGTQAEIVEPGVGGVANRFLGISPAWLRQTHLSRSVLADVSFWHVILALHKFLSTNVLCVGIQLSNLNLGLLCSCTIRCLQP